MFYVKRKRQKYSVTKSADFFWGGDNKYGENSRECDVGQRKQIHIDLRP